MPAVAADAGVIVIALMAILLVLAVYFLASALAGIARWAGVQNWPLIGGSIMNAINSLVSWAGNTAAWLWQHANPVTIVTATVHWLMSELNNVNSWFMQNVVLSIERVITQTVPNYYNLATSYAHTLYNDAVAVIGADVSALNRTIVAYYNDAIAYAGAEVAAARSFALQLYGDAVAVTDAAVAAAEARALGLVQSLQGWALQEFTAVRTWVTGEIGAAEQTLQGDIATGLHDLEQTLAPEIAAAAAVGAAAAAAFKTWETSCGDPLCTNLSGFGNIIAAIEGIITDGALVALIAGAVIDPAGTATFITDTFVQPVDDAVGVVLGAVGLQLPMAA